MDKINFGRERRKCWIKCKFKLISSPPFSFGIIDGAISPINVSFPRLPPILTFLLEKDERDSTYGNVRAKIHLLSIVPRLLGFIRPW